MKIIQPATGKTQEIESSVLTRRMVEDGWVEAALFVPPPPPAAAVVVPGHSDAPDPMPVGGLPPVVAPAAAAAEPAPQADPEESHSLPEKRTGPKFGRRKRSQ